MERLRVGKMLLWGFGLMDEKRGGFEVERGVDRCERPQIFSFRISLSVYV